MTSRTLQEFKLRQLQSNEIRFVLSLRTFPLDGKVSQLHDQIVLVYTFQGISHDAVPLTAGSQQFQQVSFRRMRFVGQAHLLAALRNIRIISLEHRNELINKLPALAIDHLTGSSHRLFPDSHQLLLGFHFSLQQSVSLQQSLVITDQRVQVFTVELRNHHIHETAAFFTAARNQQRVGWRNHHQRNQTNVIRQTRILLFIPLELLLLPSFQPAVDLLRISVIRLIKALHNEKVLVMTDILRINGIRRTLAERQIIYRIHQIGFSHTIPSDNAIHFT